MASPTHIVTAGPHKGLLCRIHATGGATTAVTYERSGWRFPLYAVVMAGDVASRDNCVDRELPVEREASHL